MEEILASIRRIIADDQDTQRPAPARRGSAARRRGRRFSTLPTFDRRRPHRRSNSNMRTCRSGDDDDQVDFEAATRTSTCRAGSASTRTCRPGSRPRHRRPTRCSPPPRDASVTTAFGMLSSTILNSNPRTARGSCQDMLRPMLKTWLDDNLPPLVERLVRAEIERISRGGPLKARGRTCRSGQFPPKAFNPSRLTSLVCSVL